MSGEGENMKRFFVLSVAALVALSMAGCASAPKTGSGSTGKALSGVPAFVKEAWLNASEDVLVGVGSYKVGSDASKVSTGKQFAETRARADLATQLNVIVKTMVDDYTVTSEADPDAMVSFQESITRQLSQARLSGARTVKMEVEDGVLWVVMEYGKSQAAEEVNQAVSAAKLAVPAAIAFDALDRMDTAFSKEAGGGPTIE
jgi:hypothetical protein